MPVECQVKFCSPHDISEASQQNMIAALSLITEVDGDFWNMKRPKQPPAVTGLEHAVSSGCV